METSQHKCQLYTAKGDTAWGNAISYDEPLVNEIGKIQSFHGWKERRPEKGDYIQIPMKSGKHFLFRLIEVKHESDPSDMFFAKGEFMGYTEDNQDIDPVPEEKPKGMMWFK